MLCFVLINSVLLNLLRVWVFSNQTLTSNGSNNRNNEQPTVAGKVKPEVCASLSFPRCEQWQGVLLPGVGGGGMRGFTTMEGGCFYRGGGGGRGIKTQNGASKLVTLP